VKKPPTKQRFVQLLQSRVKGGRITDAEQVGHERIVRLEVVSGDITTLLWVRLWGGAANILATDAEGTVLDAFYRRPKRNEVTGASFAPPEPVDTDDPERFTIRFTRPDGEGDPSVSEQIARHYAEISEDQESKLLRARLMKSTESRIARIRDQLERARARLVESDSADRLQLFGDLIRANGHRIQPGDRWLEAEDYTNENRPVAIELDEGLNPVENAARYYDRARRVKRQRTSLADEVRNLENRRTGQIAALEMVETASLDELREMDRSESGAERSKADQSRLPGLQFQSGKFTILVGRTAAENDDLLRHHVRGNDLWLHTRDVPGGYVFVRAQKNKSVPLDVLLDAGNLAVHFSKARSSGRAELYYTQVKYLRRAKSGNRGLVLPTHEKNLSVTLDPSRLEHLRT